METRHAAAHTPDSRCTASFDRKGNSNMPARACIYKYPLAFNIDFGITTAKNWSYSFFTLGVAAEKGGIKHNSYHKTCPQAETILEKMMKDFFTQDIRVPPRILRLHFHDCFVRGCDGSVLINSTSDNSAERNAKPNNPSLHGFEEIEKIKEVLEQECPGVVSCADIVTYAARESVHISGNLRYDVKGGRRDGRISRESEALLNLPPSTADVKFLIKLFKSKGLSLEDTVTLSGGHSFGASFCSVINGRHVNFNNTGRPDPTLDYSLAAKLRQECFSPNGQDNLVALDTITPTNLDNKYYMGLLQNKGLLTSDQTLLTDKRTKRQVIENAIQPSVWAKKFVHSMIKMGEIDVLTGKNGEIRRKCSVVN